MPTSRTAQWLLGAGLVLGAALRLTAAGDDGIYWPDEIYQSFEPAHRLVFGYGLVAWEFVDGARNWSFPLLVAGLLQLGRLLGLDSPAQYVPLVKGCFALLGVGTGWAVWRLARAFGAQEEHAAAGALAFCLAAPAVYFSARAMSENALAFCAALGLALLLEPGATRRRAATGAALLGLGVLFRLQGAVFCAGALAVLAWRKDRATLKTSAVVLAAFAVLYGLTDAVAWHAVPGTRWGGWFHSAFRYWEFNVVQGKGAQWGTAPWHYYFDYTFRSMPGLAVALALGLVLCARRAPLLLLPLGLFVVLHLAVAHKELRFVLPAWPLAFAALGVGLGALPQALGQKVALPLLGAAALLSAANFRALTFGDLGAYPDRPGASAWDDFGPVNRLLLAASRQQDLCGLRVDVAHLAWVGGSTYLHRNAPLYHLGQPPPESGYFNYVVTRQGSGQPPVAKEGPLELVRLGTGGCRPDPGYAWRLP